MMTIDDDEWMGGVYWCNHFHFSGTYYTDKQWEGKRDEKGVRKKTKSKRARHIYMHTSRSHNSASEFMGMCVCVWLMNGTCEDYQN